MYGGVPGLPLLQRGSEKNEPEITYFLSLAFAKYSLMQTVIGVLVEVVSTVVIVVAPCGRPINRCITYMNKVIKTNRSFEMAK